MLLWRLLNLSLLSWANGAQCAATLEGRASCDLVARTYKAPIKLSGRRLLGVVSVAIAYTILLLFIRKDIRKNHICWLWINITISLLPFAMLKSEFASFIELIALKSWAFLGLER